MCSNQDTPGHRLRREDFKLSVHDMEKIQNLLKKMHFNVCSQKVATFGLCGKKAEKEPQKARKHGVLKHF